VNHFSNSRIFTNKISTLDTLENLKFDLANGKIQSEMRLNDFFPETYRLDVVSDLVKFLNSPNEGLWLVKKSQSNQGKGIRLISDVKAYKDEILTKKDEFEKDSTELLLEKLQKMGIDGAANEEQNDNKVEKQKWTNLNALVKELSEVVIQRYIENPLLVDGRKFDIRAYMYIACAKPYLVLFHPGYVRLSLN
jgi:hypothetical protein